MTTREEEEVGRSRVEALSDGVFAIVITLLVLEIKVPHVEDHGSVVALARALTDLAPKFVSWVISFLTVCVIWMNHHRLLRLVGRFDHGYSGGTPTCCSGRPSSFRTRREGRQPRRAD